MNNHDTNKLGTYNNIIEKPNGFSNANTVTINEIKLNNDLTEITRSNSQSLSEKIDNEYTQERYVWEMRARSPNLTPSSTVLNSPDLNTDIQYVMQQQQRQHHQIRVGRSPGSQFEQNNILPQGLTSPGSPTDVGKADGQCLRDGEIVVFDDIDTNWMNKANNSNHTTIQPDLLQNNEDILKVTKMIGQLPIAQYEGSPRRFGNHPVTTLNLKPTLPSITGSTVVYPKRPPGFPQRVSPKSVIISRNEEMQPIKSVISASHLPHNNKSTGNLIDIDDDSYDNKSSKVKTPTFDYLYECSETRKVLEEFFKGNIDDEKRFIEIAESGDDIGSCDTHNDCERRPESEKHIDQAYVGQRLARIPKEELILIHRSPKKQTAENSFNDHNNIDHYIDSNSRSSADVADTELEVNLRRHSRNFTLSPETTDYDSNCGDLDSLSNDINCPTDYGKLYTSMPVLEDGLSSGHASDTENNVQSVCDKSESKVTQQCTIEQNQYNTNLRQCYEIYSEKNNPTTNHIDQTIELTKEENFQQDTSNDILIDGGRCNINPYNNPNDLIVESQYEAVYAAATTIIKTPATPPASIVHHQTRNTHPRESADILEAMKEIRSALQRAKTQPEKLKFCDEVLPPDPDSPVWVPRKASANSVKCMINNSKNCGKLNLSIGREEDELDTDLETDRLLGQQRHDEQADFFDDKTIWPKTSRISGCESIDSPQSLEDLNLLGSGIQPTSHKSQTFSSATIRQGIGTSLTSNSPDHCQVIGNADASVTSPEKLQYTKSPTGSIKSLKDSANIDKKTKARNKEGLLDPAVLIEGVLFRARYLGSTQLVCEGQPTKSTRMMQAEEAVSRIKAPEGESQPSTEVDLFISTEKIMVLNTDLKEIMMDHALRTISYIADIGDLVVLMARRRFVSSPDLCGSDNDINQCNDNKENGTSCGSNSSSKHNRTPKMICHVFESDEAQFIAQSIGQAFQVAYMEFLKANGIENDNLAKEMDYQEVLNSQEIFGDELEIFAKKELQKEVVVPKAKGEILGVVIVESGWGSMLPTVVIANLMSGGAAARCGQLNIGDQLIAINGLSLVGLPLSTCQNYIRNTKNQTAVKFTVVPCPPVVEVKIIRPKALFQLGFSVQNGVICSLLRGGIAERGGVRVGHRIIEINNQSVVAVPHDTIVKLLSSSVGEILMKTMPTSMFRLLTGQETPIYI